MSSGPGSVLAAPKLVTLSFQGYEAQYRVKEYGEWIVQSTWLQSVGSDYGVGLGTHLADLEFPYTFPSSTRITDSQIHTFLEAVIADGGVPGGAAAAQDPSIVYMVYYPDTVTIVASDQSESCVQFGGYHSSFTTTAGSFVYAVVATCDASGPDAVSPTLSVPHAASHELIEAATDPNPSSVETLGYLFDDGNDPWAYDAAEVGDVCVGAPLAMFDGGFVAQRIWSNTLAAAGNGSPCGPVPPGETYFTVSPVATGRTDGLAVLSTSTAAQTVTFTLTGWSNVPTADWVVYPAQTSGTFQPSAIAISADGQAGGQSVTLNNGGSATLSITVPAGTGSQNYAAIELLSSQDPTFQTYNEWPVAVVVE